MTGPWIAALVAVAALSVITAVLVLGLLRRLSVVLQGVEQQLRAGSHLGGVPEGSQLPAFEVIDAAGKPIESSRLLTGPPILLFLSAGCTPCESLIIELAAEVQPVARTQLVAILQSEAAIDAVIPGVMLVADATAFQSLSVSTTPFAMAVDRDRTVVARAVPNSIESLRQLERTLGTEVVATG